MSRLGRPGLVLALGLVISLIGAGGAQAVVVDMSGLGHSSVPYGTSDRSGYVGVALVPGTCSDLVLGQTCASLAAKGVPTVASQGPCTDPALTPDLVLQDTGLCAHGGDVLASSENFALTWDADRGYWAGTRGYVEQFLRDVADGSGTLTSPYAVTTQYNGRNGRAQNNSKYGGGCIDFGIGGSCDFTAWNGSGHSFQSNGCQPAGDSFTDVSSVGGNGVCLTDAQLQGELSAMVHQTGVVGRTQPGYSPAVTLLLPPGVEACLDASGTLCSANGSLTPPPSTLTANTAGGELAAGGYEVETTYSTAAGEQLPSAPQSVAVSGTAPSLLIASPPSANGATGWNAYVKGPGAKTFSRVQKAPIAIGAPINLTTAPSNALTPPHPPFFCSYHSRVKVDGAEVEYVVQPWTAMTACDEPDAQPLPPNPTPQQLSTNVGARLVSPLSQAQIASIVNPDLDGWFALDGSEINDNGGCVPRSDGLDSVQVGNSSQNPYLLQREFNNAGAIEFEPNTYFGCAPDVLLTPAFVVPSAIDQGDEVQLDGSVTASTLVVPASGYKWDFGDGTAGTGPAVVHTYSTTGTYAVKLTVTDRGGNVRTLTQTIDVLGPNGEPPVTATGSGAGTGAGTGPSTNTGASTPGSTTASPTPGAPPSHPRPRLQVRLQLMPQALTGVLRSGLTVVVTSNEAVDGLASISIPRSAAKRAHLKVGRGPSVMIGQGTVSGIANGKTTLHLRLSRSVASKLKALRHVALTVRMALSATGGQHAAIDVAGHY